MFDHEIPAEPLADLPEDVQIALGEKYNAGFAYSGPSIFNPFPRPASPSSIAYLRRPIDLSDLRGPPLRLTVPPEDHWPSRLVWRGGRVRVQMKMVLFNCNDLLARIIWKTVGVL